jgi:hypothetical protein
MLGQKPYSAHAITKGDKIFTQKSHAQWRALWLGYFL